MTDSAEKMRKADRTRIFFDTEFIEDGKTIDLISIGMVRDDGETYYAESSDCDLSRADQWVKDNVLIHLRGGSAIKSRRQIAADIVAFAGPSPEFWAYYADYDWVVLCQLFGRMIDLPNGWPMFCRDLKQLAGDTVLPQQISTEHHALADAVWVSETFAALSAKSDGGGESRPAETGTGGLAPCIKQTTPATMPAQAGVAPGPSDPIPSQPDEREAMRPTIPTCCVTGAIPGDDCACGDCDPCTLGEHLIPDAVKRLIAEKNSLLQRVCELEDQLHEAQPAPIAGLEPVAWQWHVHENSWCVCDPPEASELQSTPQQFRALYTRAQLEAHAAEQVRAERKRIATWHDDAAIRTRSSDA